MSSAKKNKSINFFKKFTGFKGKVTEKVFNEALEGLKEELEDGLTQKEIDTLVSFITLTDITQTRFTAVVKCLMPMTSVSPEATKNIILWVASYYHVPLKKSVISALQWINGLVEYKLTDIEVINDFYELFFVLQKVDYLQRQACQLIYSLTKVDDVSRWKVQNALLLYKKNNSNKHIAVLLSRYKSLRPECVPENIPAINIHLVFSSAVWLREFFHLAQLRSHVGPQEKGTVMTKEIMWNALVVKKDGKRLKMNVIPPVQYVNLGSNLYEKKTHSVLTYNDMITLGCNQLSVDIPCNVLSLLLNKAGHHLVTFGNEELIERLNATVYSQLQAVFYRGKVPLEEREYFLEQLLALEKYMLQGIPAVTYFLKDYLLLWNGKHFQKCIFELLEWITCSSFDQMKTDILNSIHNIFVSSDTETKCLIVATMRRLVLNMFVAATNDDEPGFDANVMIPEVIFFVERMIVLGLTIEDDNVALLNEAFTFYEVISHLEELSHLPLFTAIPPGVLYKGFFTRILSFVDRVCGLLIRYKTVHNSKLKELDCRALFTKKFEIISLYAADIMNCLWHSQAISDRERGYIFNEMPMKMISQISKQLDLDSSFSLKNNIAFRPFFLEPGLRASSKEVIGHLDEHFPNILEFQSFGILINI